LSLRHVLVVVFGAVPALLFMCLPLARMSAAFEQPAVAELWSGQA
jgi:hypothetical protein